MKYSSSWRKPYRPLTASSAATKTPAISHTGAGRRPEPGIAAGARPEPGTGAGGTAARARRPPALGGGAASVPAGRVGWPAGVTMLMLVEPEPPFKPPEVPVVRQG